MRRATAGEARRIATGHAVTGHAMGHAARARAGRDGSTSEARTAMGGGARDRGRAACADRRTGARGGDMRRGGADLRRRPRGRSDTGGRRGHARGRSGGPRRSGDPRSWSGPWSRRRGSRSRRCGSRRGGGMRCPAALQLRRGGGDAGGRRHEHGSKQRDCSCHQIPPGPASEQTLVSGCRNAAEPAQGARTATHDAADGLHGGTAGSTLGCRGATVQSRRQQRDTASAREPLRQVASLSSEPLAYAPSDRRNAIRTRAV